MDFQEARERRGDAVAARRVTERERAADARLRRRIREAFARQAPPDDAQPRAVPRLRVVRDDRS
jgi:hypothetical protein